MKAEPNPARRLRDAIHWWVRRDPLRYSELHAALLSSRAGVTVEQHLFRTVVYGIVAGVIAGTAGFFFAALVRMPGQIGGLYDIFNLPHLEPPLILIQIISAIILFIVTFAIVYRVYMKIPALQASSRATRINLTIHNAVSFMYAMRRGGAPLMVIYRALSENASVYGEVAYEFRQIVRDADYFGYDELSATRNLIETTPSEKFRTFLEDMVSVIESGGNLTDFLFNRVRLYHEEAGFEQKQFLTTLQMMAETYVTVFVAGPIFLVIIMVVMGMMGGGAILQLSVVGYLLIPVGSVLFILFIDMISPPAEVVERYIHRRELKEYREVPRYEEPGEEHLFKRLERYDRYRKIRNFVRHPVEGVMRNPKLTFAVTGPITLAYILYIILAVPRGYPLELYIDIVDDHIFFAILILLIPYSIFYEIWRYRIMGIEAGIPDFLDRLGGINRVGLTIAQAIGLMVRTNLGVISYEIRRIKRDIDWGANVEEALIRFEERIRTPAISRTVTLITKASEMSGDIGEVLAIAASDAEMAEKLKKERRADMFAYTAIIYVAFFVFLFIVVVINNQFLSVLREVDTSGLSGAGGSLALDTITRLLYHIGVVQALFSGLIGGLMGEASVRAGVKHSIILMAVALIVFMFTM
ncbi:MAG: type II secretion system F family protein [Methanoculleaceae archaeon]